MLTKLEIEKLQLQLNEIHEDVCHASEFGSDHKERQSVESKFNAIIHDLNKLFDSSIKWIPIADDKPKEFGRYLVRLKNDAVYEMTFNPIDKRFKHSLLGIERENNPVVYWSELPQFEN